eukprot:UN03862
MIMLFIIILHISFDIHSLQYLYKHTTCIHIHTTLAITAYCHLHTAHAN